MLNVLNSAPCSSCHQACCRDYIVTVTGHDAWLLARTYRLAMEQFLVCCAAGEGGNDEYFRLDRSGRYHAIALGKRSIAGEAGWCAFWMPFGNGDGRCGVYSSRPQVCRDYPFVLQDGAVGVRENASCPAGGWDGRDLSPWTAGLLRFRFDRDVYRYCVRAWNAYVEACPDGVAFPVNVYFGYLTAVYDRLDEIAGTLNREDWVALLGHWAQFPEDGDVEPIDCLPDRQRIAQIVWGLRSAVDEFPFDPEQPEEADELAMTVEA